MNWHLPNISKKICPYKSLQAIDVGHICRGQNKLLEMRMVVQVMINKLKENADLYDVYKSGCKNLHTLGDIYDKVKYVYLDRMAKKKKARFAQLSWETFVREARSIKLNVPVQSRVPIAMNRNEEIETPSIKAKTTHSSNVPPTNRHDLVTPTNALNIPSPKRPISKNTLSQFGIVSPEKQKLKPQSQSSPSTSQSTTKKPEGKEHQLNLTPK